MGITGWGGVTLTVEIDLSQATEGVGSGGSTYVALWGVARWGEDVWPSGVVWTDVSDKVLSVVSTASFSDQLDTYNAGSLSLILDNDSGDFSPDNPSSPYRVCASTTIGVLRPIRVRGEADGVSFTLFTGRTQTWNESHLGETSTVTVTAVDPFAELGAFDSYEQSSQGAGETFGERIARILDNARWRGERRIDVGEHTMQATTLAQETVTLLKLTAASEGGAVWVAPDGAFCADGQNALLEKDRSINVQVEFSNNNNETSILYEPGVDVPFDGEKVKNRAAYARAGGTVQLRTSLASEKLYGPRQDQRSDLICETDAQADKLARRTIALRQEAERRIEKITFLPELQPSAARVALAWHAIASGKLTLRGLARFLHTTEAGFDIEKYVFVRGITHRITPESWAVDVTFTSATVMRGIVDSRWGVATWGASRWPF